jgi:hypothetical protein
MSASLAGLRFHRATMGRFEDVRFYDVTLDGRLVGLVAAVWPPSHIRRGRTQVNPSWQAYYAGQKLGDPQRTRQAAAELLAKRARPWDTSVWRSG